MGLATGNAWAVDGWDLTGRTAANAGMGTDYFSNPSEYDLWINPSTLNAHTGKAYIYFDDTPATDEDILGANIATGVGNFGLYIGRNNQGVLNEVDDLYNDGTFTRPGAGFVPDLDTYLTGAPAKTLVDPKFDIFYGNKANAINWGARLSYASASYKDSPAKAATQTHSQEFDSRDINFSVGMEMPDQDLDAAFIYGLINFSGKHDFTDTGIIESEELENDGSSSLGLSVRKKLQKKKDSYVLVSGLYTSDKLGAKNSIADSDAPAAYVDKYSEETTVLGVSGSYHLQKGSNRFIASGGFLSVKINEVEKSTNAAALEDLDTETDILAIPATLSFELNQLGESKKWSFRGSVNKNLYSTTETTFKDKQTPTLNSKEESSNPTPVGVSVGLTYKPIKALTIDAAMNRLALYRGTGLLSTGAGNLFTRVTISYAM